MRLHKIVILLAGSLIFGSVVQSYSQISNGGQPYSLNHELDSAVDVKEMPVFDIERLIREDEFAGKEAPYRFGYGFDVSFNLRNSGTWDSLPDGSKLWRLKLISRGAYSLNLIYDKFWLPEDSKFFIYDNDKSMVIGAFTSYNNKIHGKFATSPIKGDEIILEYFEPKKNTEAAEISISRIIHGYKSLFKTTTVRSLIIL